MSQPYNVLVSRICILQQKLLDSGLAEDPGRLNIETDTGKGYVYLSVGVDSIRLVNAMFTVDAASYLMKVNYWIKELDNLPRESAIAGYIINEFARTEHFKEVAPDES